MKTNKDHDDTIEEDRLHEFNRFPKLYCPLLRRHVFHGVKETETEQTLECLSCGDIINMYKEDRNKIEKSLWESYNKYKDQVDLSPPPQKRHKKRWDIKYLILRGKKT